MLFVVLVIVIFVAAGGHIALARPMTAARAELFLVNLVAGYYGLCMLFAALIHLSNGPAVARMKGWPEGNPIQTLYAFALIGVGLSALLTILFRGTYVIGPAVAGAVLSLGGLYVHGRAAFCRIAICPKSSWTASSRC